MLDLPDLHYYDLYAPLVKSVDTEYSVEEAEKNILRRVGPAGDGICRRGEARVFRSLDRLLSHGR